MKVTSSPVLLAFLLSFAAAAGPQKLDTASKTTTNIPADGTELQAVRPKPATPITIGMNSQVLSSLNFADQQDYVDAQTGWLATLPEVVIRNANNQIVYSLNEYDFLHQQVAPDTVNPSLWRMAQLNLTNGLYEVLKDKIYQIRSFDAANMTIVEGATGIIVIDPLGSAETAKAGLDLYYSCRTAPNTEKRKVMAVIYTHSHVDHYGGVRGIITDDDVNVRKVPVIAPEGFLEAAVSENVYAGTAMSRRLTYLYGSYLPKNDRGVIDNGIGKAVSTGTLTLIAPTETISKSGLRTPPLDGVNIEFMIVSGTEAPSEMTLWFPDWKVLNAAEIACPLMHNILTLRGAQVRDAKKWSEMLTQLIASYGDQAAILFNQHHWPKWGNSNVVALLKGERDMYKFLHDQTLRLTNEGYTGIEIAEMLQLPPSLAKQWWSRGYYGTVSHNVKAIYQKYIGWFDGNPANLHNLPPEDAGAKLIQYMGGSNVAIAKARRDFERGEYRWVAWIMGQVVFGEPNNWQARALEADALEQLGYQSEAATWRNAYLVGAWELRNGILKGGSGGASASADTITAMTMPMYFDYMGIRLNGMKAEGRKFAINWTITHPATSTTPAEPDENYAVNLENCALTYRAWTDPTAALSVTMSRATLDAITLGKTSFQKALQDGSITYKGDLNRLLELLSILDTFELYFPIVTP